MVPAVEAAFDSSLTKLADMKPPMPKEEIPRLLYVDFSEIHMAGKTEGHPFSLAAVVERAKTTCALFPEAPLSFAKEVHGPDDACTILIYIYYIYYIHICHYNI